MTVRRRFGWVLLTLVSALVVPTGAAGAVPVSAAPVAVPAPAASTVPAPAVAAAPAGKAGRCTGTETNAVTVVVDFQALGGTSIVRCAYDLPSPATGAQALAAAGIAWTGLAGDATYVCRLAGRPAADEAMSIPGNPGYLEDCDGTPPAAAYWSYWSAASGCDWTYQTRGATSSRVQFGGFEGWSFSLNAGSTVTPKPRLSGGLPRRFTDVPLTSLFCRDIDWLAAEGISTGWPGPGGTATYRPGASIHRDAMAAFLYRLAHPGAALPSCATKPFEDVPVGSPFCGAIAWMKTRGISTGTTTGGKSYYKPTGSVTRSDMAAFLYRYAHGTATIPACPAAGSGFLDVGRNAQFCGAIRWMRTSGISTGWTVPAGREYRPATPVTREAMAAFLHRGVETEKLPR